MTGSDRSIPSEPQAVYPIVRLVASLAMLTLGGSAMYATVVVLKPIALEFGVSRGIGSIPYMLYMAGFGVGGIILGRLADRFGVLAPALIGSLGLPAGFIAASYAGTLWQFCLALGLLCGLLGGAATFVPLISDISHWFTRRRGLAVGILVSGSYVAGAIWPPVLQHFFDTQGWRETYFEVGIVLFCVMLPLCALFYRRSPIAHVYAGDGSESARRPLGLAPNTLQRTVCVAGIGCCVGMSMPQVHIVAHVTDLGYTAARGAEILSLMLGCGIVSRLTSGWISDRVGGLRTLLLGSVLQALVLVFFLGADSLTALYVVAAAFGLSQGGIVPSYAIIIRTYFPPGEAGRRIGTTILFTIIGMALGGWLAGALYDLTGSYTASFINAIAFNVMNMSIVAVLVARSRRLA